MCSRCLHKWNKAKKKKSSHQDVKLDKTGLVWEENFSQKHHGISVPGSLRTEQQRLTNRCFRLSRTLDWDLSQLCGGGGGGRERKSFSPPRPLYPITSSGWYPSQPVAAHFRDIQQTLLWLWAYTAHGELGCLEILLYYNNERSKEILLKYNVTAEVLWPCWAGFTHSTLGGGEG